MASSVRRPRLHPRVGQEQLVRDVRITQIYEAPTDSGLDLVGAKLSEAEARTTSCSPTRFVISPPLRARIWPSSPSVERAVVRWMS